MYQLDTHDTSHVDEWPYLPKIIDPTFPNQPMISQQTKKVVFDSLGLVDFAIGLVNSVLNLPDGQVILLGEFKLQKKIMQSILLIKSFQAFDLIESLKKIEMTFDLVNASYRN